MSKFSPFPGSGSIMYAVIDKNSSIIIAAVFASSVLEAESFWENTHAIEVTDKNSPWTLHTKYEGVINDEVCCN